MPAAGASASGTKLAPLAKAFGWAGAVGVDPPDDATERGDVGLRGGVGAPFGATVCGSVGTPGANSAEPLRALPLTAFAGVKIGDCATGPAPATLGVLNPTFIGICPRPFVFAASTFVRKNYLLDVFRIGYSQLLICQQPIRV